MLLNIKKYGDSTVYIHLISINELKNLKNYNCYQYVNNQ